jgi:hypothetical protein
VLILVRMTWFAPKGKIQCNTDRLINNNVQEDCDDKQDHILHLPPWVPAFLVERPFYRVGKSVYFR